MVISLKIKYFFMKNLLYLVVLVLGVFSCSPNDENSSSDINPPVWIHGSWLVEGTVTGSTGFKFTSNDVVMLQNFLDTSQRTLINRSRELGQEVLVKENISKDLYSLRLEFQNGQTVNFDFTKISDTEITWNQVANSVLVRQ